MKLPKKIIIIISSIVLLLITVSGIYAAFEKEDQIHVIKSNPEISTAKIVDFDNLNEYNTNGCWIYFEYTINNKKYRNCKKYHGWKKDDNYFQNLTFPIVYCKDQPELSRLLIIKEDYEIFGMVQPDSLKKYNRKVI